MNFHSKWGDADQALARIKHRRQPRGLDGLAIPRDEIRRSDMRDADRHSLPDAKFPIRFRGRNHDVRLVNLSGGGAMIASRLRPSLGEHLELHLGEGSNIECVVRWVKEGRIGLEFAHETQLDCSDDERAELLRKVIKKAFPGVAVDRARVQYAASDQRSAARHPLIWGGELVYGPSSWPMRVRNISSTGALVQCAGGPEEGCEILFDLAKAGTVNATVSWAVGDHRGLQFDEPFDLNLLAKAKPSVAPPRWMRPAYLEDDVPAESAWDEAWCRMSVDELREHLEGYLKR
jgi:hypothetical protein